jgi:FMN phosphatase YigB (HAD superfamily)
VFSNFNTKLNKILKELCNITFKDIIISEVLGVAKPDLLFYNKAIQLTGVNSENILYIGDSLKLDVIPGNTSGMNSILIDRDDLYPNYKNRVKSFNELPKLIELWCD